MASRNTGSTIVHFEMMITIPDHGAHRLVAFRTMMQHPQYVTLPVC
jgi:hypothetical protein